MAIVVIAIEMLAHWPSSLLIRLREKRARTGEEEQSLDEGREEELEETEVVVEEDESSGRVTVFFSNAEPARRFLRKADEFLAERNEDLQHFVNIRRRLTNTVELLHNLDRTRFRYRLFALNSQLVDPPNQLAAPTANVYAQYIVALDETNGKLDMTISVPPINVLTMPVVDIFAIVERPEIDSGFNFSWIDVNNQQRQGLSIGQRLPIRSFYLDATFRDLRAPNIDAPHTVFDNVFMASLPGSPTIVYLKL